MCTLSALLQEIITLILSQSFLYGFSCLPTYHTEHNLLFLTIISCEYLIREISKKTRKQMLLTQQVAVYLFTSHEKNSTDLKKKKKKIYE